IMLAGMDQRGRKLRGRREGPEQGRQLHEVRPGAADTENTNRLYWAPHFYGSETGSIFECVLLVDYIRLIPPLIRIIACPLEIFREKASGRSLRKNGS